MPDPLNPFDPKIDPFQNPLNRIKSWTTKSTGQFNQEVVNPDSPDFRTHRGYVPGTGRQFFAGTERIPRDGDR